MLPTAHGQSANFPNVLTFSMDRNLDLLFYRKVCSFDLGGLIVGFLLLSQNLN